jgi:hypothetical protein
MSNNSLIAKLERHKTELSTKGDDYLSNLKSMKDELVRILQMVWKALVIEELESTKRMNSHKSRSIFAILA